MAVACLFGLILGISAFYAEIGLQRMEKCLPLSIGTMVIFLYVFGLMNNLYAGVLAVLLFGVIAAAAAFVLAIRKKRLLKLLSKFASPGMVIYYVLCVAIYAANAGKPVKGWDEFTYWADAVKIMTQLQVLPSAPEARSLFASYPPALPLWQYLLQAINGLLSGNILFEEPWLYMSFQWLLVALYAPFLDRLSWRRPLECVVCGALIPLVTMAVFPLAFNQLNSDALVGALGGFVCAYAFFHPHMKGVELATQMVMLAVLVLVKDAGILFALAGIAVAAINTGGSQKAVLRLKPAVFCVLAVAAARGSWSIHAAAVGAAAQETFSNPVSLSVLLDPSQHWRITTLRNFVYKFFEMMVPVQGTTLSISYCMMFAVLAAGFLTLYMNLKETQDARRIRKLAALIFGTVAVYWIGTGITYVFKFYEDEAVRLASYERYLNIAVLFAAFVLFVCFLQMRHPAWEKGLSRRTAACVMAVFMLFAPFSGLLNAVSRLDAQAASQSQEAYLTLEQKVRLAAKPEDKIYIVAAGSGGFEKVVMRYRLRPLHVGDEPWNIGVGVEEDRFTAERSVEELGQCLAEGYDLLVICALTEEFSQTYAALFESPESLAVGQIYRVNKETGLLQLVS